MRKYYLFLDDERTPKDVYRYKDNPIYVDQVWTKATSYSEFLDKFAEKYAEGFLPAAISFDHDLHPEHYRMGQLTNFRDFDETAVKVPTGWHCLRWLLAFYKTNDLELPKILFHTKNTGGAQNMTMLLDEYKFNLTKEDA